MIEIPFSNGHTHQLKSAWEELTPEQYKTELDYIAQFLSGVITLRRLRIKTFYLLSGQKPRLYGNAEGSEQQAENIYRISQLMTFMLRIEYENAKSFSKLNKEMREKLMRYLPEELEQTPEVRWAEKAVKEPKPDLVFARNLIPTIGRRRHIWKGYTFEVSDKILITSLTTSQFISAQTVAIEIQETGRESLLDLLVAILYCYTNDPIELALNREKLYWLDLATKKAIYINFNAIQSYLITRTKYSILFNSPVTEPIEAKAKPKHNLGLGSVVNSLIKAGYSDMDNSNLVKFFEIMYSDLISNVTNLHKQGLTIDKIAEHTGLTISKINQIL